MAFDRLRMLSEVGDCANSDKSKGERHTGDYKRVGGSWPPIRGFPKITLRNVVQEDKEALGIDEANAQHHQKRMRAIARLTPKSGNN